MLAAASDTPLPANKYTQDIVKAIEGLDPDARGFFDVHENEITFLLQAGPRKQFGTNGCQVDALIRLSRNLVEQFSARAPCRENALVITKLDEALHWLAHRTWRREACGVEGTDAS